jgi:hypothetical protein
MRPFGKWSQQGVPKSGWTCIEPVDDLGEPSETCQMCEHQTIRYVHVMQHPVYADVLRCGCDCAGRMEGDPEAAIERERIAKNGTARLRASERRKDAFASKEWKRSANGNETALYLGYRITVYPKRGRWGVTVSRAADEFVQHGKNFYLTPKAAKQRAMQFIEDRDDS